MANEQTAGRGFFFSVDDLAKHDQEVAARALREAADAIEDAEQELIRSGHREDGTRMAGLEQAFYIVRARADRQDGAE